MLVIMTIAAKFELV